MFSISVFSICTFCIEFAFSIAFSFFFPRVFAHVYLSYLRLITYVLAHTNCYSSYKLLLKYICLICVLAHMSFGVAVCCSVLQCVAVCCSVLQCVVAVCCSVLQCVAVCCSVLQCIFHHTFLYFSFFDFSICIFYCNFVGSFCWAYESTPL